MTIVSRLQLDHPTLGTAGGAALHSAVEALYVKLGDNLASRFMSSTNIAGSGGTFDFEHNYKAAFDDLRFDLYTVSGGELTEITAATTPNLSEVVVTATVGFETTKVTITNNNASAFDFAMVMVQDPINLRELVDVDLSTAPEDSQALVYNAGAGQWVPGSSGDASFKLQSITANVATFKSGAINLPDGKQLNLAADLAVDLKTEVNTLGVTAPAATTGYYVYLDLLQLPAQTVDATADRKIYEVTKGVNGMFVVKAEDPQSVDSTRYVWLAAVKTDGTPDYVAFENLAFREHTSSSVVVSAKASDTLTARSIGTVGASDNGYGALADSDFPTPANAAYYHLDGDALNDGTAGGDLTEQGTHNYAEKGFFGREDLSRLAGAEVFKSTDAHFNPGAGISWSMGCWVKNDYASNQLVMAREFATGDRAAKIQIEGNTEWRFFATNTAGSWDVQINVPFSYDAGEWHHVALTYDFSATTVYAYVDGQLAGSASLANTRALSTADFNIGGQRNGTSLLMSNGAVQDAFFVNPGALTDAQINDIYSKRYSGKQLVGHVLDADSFNCADLTDKVSFYNLSSLADDSVNSNDLTAGGGITVGGALDIHGGTTATQFDGVDDILSSADPFYDFTTAFTVGGWVAIDDASTIGTFWAKFVAAGNQRSTRVRYDGAGNLEVFLSSNGSSADIALFSVTVDMVSGQYYHWVAKYDNSSVYIYIDGVLAGSTAATGILNNSSGDFVFGANDGNQPWPGRMDELFAANYAMSDADIQKLYAGRIDLSAAEQNVLIRNRQWKAQYTLEEGGAPAVYDLDSADYILDQKQDKLYVDFGGDGEKIDLSLYDGGAGSGSVIPSRIFDNLFTSDPTGTIAHSLAGMPTDFAILHNSLADGQWQPLDPESYLKADSTNLYVTGMGALTIDATHPIRIIAGFGGTHSLKKDDKVVVTTTYNASAGVTMLLDSSGGVFTVTLPATPGIGDEIPYIDMVGGLAGNNVTLNGNGNTINGSATQLLDTNDTVGTILFNGSEWRLY